MYHPPYAGINNNNALTCNQRNLIVNYIPDSIDKTELQQLFQKFGPIESVRIIHDGNAHSKGYGFVKFVNAESAQQAIAEMNGHSLGGKRLKVGLAKHEQQVSSGSNRPENGNPAPVLYYFFPIVYVIKPAATPILPVNTWPFVNVSTGLIPSQQGPGFFTTTTQPPALNIRFAP